MASLFSEFNLKDITLKKMHRGLADVPVLSGRRCSEHVASGASRRARGGWSRLSSPRPRRCPTEGRISAGDTGLWNDEQAEAWAPVAAFVKRYAVPGIQIAHAGRKASANRPWEGDDQISEGDARAWTPIAPSATAFGGNLPRVPHEMTKQEIARVRGEFVSATKRALAAGFEWLELHFAHGYLGQSFFSPIANKRSDEYGGSFREPGPFSR